jgi:hypothetical protein
VKNFFIDPTSFQYVKNVQWRLGRQAHLTGKVAQALFAKAPDLFSQESVIERVDVLASKFPA